MRDFAILILVVSAIAGLVATTVFAISAHSWLMASCDQYRKIFRNGERRRMILQTVFSLALSLLAGLIMLLEG